MTRIAGILETPAGDLELQLLRASLAFVPGLRDHAGEAARRERDLERRDASPGTTAKTSWTCFVNSLVWSSVALGAACTIPNTTLWSSVGASSFCENM